MSLKKYLLCSVAVFTAALVNSASAADLPVKAPPMAAPPPITDWRGSYIGVHLGYGEASFPTIADISNLSRGDIINKPSGIIGGVHAGHNWQTNSFVYGLEGDLDGAFWYQRTFFGTSPRNIENRVNLLASLRGRAGLAFDHTLLYVTGGLAFTNAKFISHSPGGTIHGNGTFNKFGYVLGGGGEWKYNPKLSFRVEGLWYKFDAKKNFGTDHIWLNEFRDAWVARAGITYQLN